VFVLLFVTSIILRYTKNTCKICNCKPHPLKANFVTNTLMKFHLDQSTFRKVIARIQRGPDFMKRGVVYCGNVLLLSIL